MTKGILAGYVDRDTLAAELRCSWRTVARYEKAEGLPSIFVGGRLLYSVADVKAWLNDRADRQTRERRERGAKRLISRPPASPPLSHGKP